MEKVAIVINCFPSDYYIRTKYFIDTLKELGYNVISYTSTFDHYTKREIKVNTGQEQIKTIGYKKNISLRRMMSHIVFAVKCYRIINKIKPQVIYVNIPPNLLLKFAAKYKRKYKNSKLICDVCDLWPESMNIKTRNKFVTAFLEKWKLIRGKYLSDSDLVICECDYFKNTLYREARNTHFATMYMCKPKLPTVSRYSLCNKDEVNFIYIGTINKLVDIDMTEKLIKVIGDKKKVVLHIIGDGERKKEYIKRAICSGAEIHDYGIVFDEKEKNIIFEKCDWGLNLIRQDLAIGLTTKSIDYLSAGIPLVNNVKFDTEMLVEEYNSGVNVSYSNLKAKAEIVIDSNSYGHYVTGANRLFVEHLSDECFYSSCKYEIGRMLKNES